MSRHTTHRRRRAPNDVVYRTASGGVLIAAGPAAGPAAGLSQWVARILHTLR